MNEQKRDALAEAIEGSGSLPAHASDEVNWWNARGIADALLPLVDTWLEEAELRGLIGGWDEGYVQAVRDHKMRRDDEAHCDWPTTPNPYASQETSA